MNSEPLNPEFWRTHSKLFFHYSQRHDKKYLVAFILIVFFVNRKQEAGAYLCVHFKPDFFSLDNAKNFRIILRVKSDDMVFALIRNGNQLFCLPADVTV